MIVAIVTGHSRGLGWALASELLSQEVPVMGLSRQTGAPTTRPQGNPMDLLQVSLDLSDSRALAAWLATDALATFTAKASQVLLFNNAGRVDPMGPPGRLNATDIAAAVALNVAAPLMLTDALAAATPRGVDVRVVHISSGAARTPYAGWGVYCATKAALDMHARAVQLDGLPHLRIASVAPGVIDTDMQAAIRASSPSDFPLKPRFEALQREGQLAPADDVARRLLAYVGSDAFGTQPTADLRQL